jgi:protein Mpv17
MRPGGWLVWALREYVRVLERAPLRTKMLTAGALGAASDVIAQSIERAAGRSATDGGEGGAALNWRRVLSLAVVGAVLTAPMFHGLYDVLDKLLPCSVRGWRAWRNTVLQLAVDQLVAAPAWLIMFYGLFAALEHGALRVADVADQIRRDFLPSMKLTWTVFPVFQLISFAFLPTKLRVLVLNVVDLGYIAALSLLQHT